MARVSTYLNLPGNTEEAFNFYKTVFGTDFIGGISRMDDMPTQPGQPPLSDEEKNLVINVQLPTLGEHVLMGTDVVNSNLIQGNNVYINLEPDTRQQTDELFAALSVGGEVKMPLQVMFWGDYFGSLTDKYGIQ